MPRRAARAVLLAASLAGLLAGGSAGWYAWRVLPQTDGVLPLGTTAEANGLPAADIRIERDADGIPTIRAATVDDVLFGLGFVHAQDRLWQLETHRRIGAGRLAEVFGEPALDTDRFVRALGVRRAAAAQWAATRGASRSAVLAYTAGINAFLSRAMNARPPEFVILGVRPEPWTPEDTLSWAIMMAWDLGGNWSTELLRMRLALRMPVARIDELLPPYPGDRPLVTTDYAALFRALKVDGQLGRQALAAAPPSGLDGIGSNNWALAGSRTTTSRPLLANDPHLRLSTPSLWYLARLDAPGLQVAGATLPALPAVVLGQNRHVAWGYTNTGADVQDVYLERIDPADPGRYQTPDGWAEFESHDEVIGVKGRPDVRIAVRSTRHGPVISDAGGAATDGLTGPPLRPGYALALRWTALDADPGTLDAALAIQRAESVAGFIAASAAHVAPMQNMAVADDAGHIGIVSAGRVPLRRADNDLKGHVPSPGWDARYDWAGFVPAAATPREVDPPRGHVASANQKVQAADYPYHLGSEWTAPYRQQRIEQLLAAKPKHDLASLRAMQADQLSLAALRLLPFARGARSTHPLAAAAQQQLAGFDGTMAGDRAAPLIFWAWTRQLTQAIFADEIGAPLFERLYGGRTFRAALEGVLEDARDHGEHSAGAARWCDDQTTPYVVENCRQQIDAAFTRALDELQAAYGADVARWRWDAAHVARAEHRPFSRVPALARWFELRTPVGGDTDTLNVSRVGLRPDALTGERYLAEHGPGFRGLYDLADPAKSRVVQSSGQSGIAWSPLYRAFVGRWARVEDVPLWSDAAAPAHALVLRRSPG